MITGIAAVNPVILAAVPERVYDRWAIAEVVLAGTGTAGDPTRGRASLRPYRVLEDGSVELGPDAATRQVTASDLQELAEADPEVAAALEAVRVVVARLAAAQGLL